MFIKILLIKINKNYNTIITKFIDYITYNFVFLMKNFIYFD